MKKFFYALILCALSFPAAHAWEVKGDKIKTRWAADVTPESAWQSYPRPQLVREQWQNLNGLWNYSVTPIEQSKTPATFDGEILVPYSIESALSGVQRTFLPTDKLWYHRVFEISEAWRGKDIILHFEAVDYDCILWINGRKVGEHRGGNNSFSFDITKYIKKRGAQQLVLSVVDPTDTQTITRGKQQLKSLSDQARIWYTPVSGIWKSVWIEAVGDCYVKQVLPSADIERGSVELDFDVAGVRGGERVAIDVKSEGKVIRSVECDLTSKVVIDIPNAELWCPKNPKLYHFDAVVKRQGKEVDRVSSYFALREVGLAVDECGYSRVSLNGRNIFQYGTLDQGWWPDGLLTPPTEEAMLWDMQQLKAMGFNTIRKHIKVEPELYYYYADSLGLMVWQDMVSGFASADRLEQQIKPRQEREWDAPAEHAKQWESEMFEMIDRLRFYPSITTWVVFNEGWGQYNTVDVVSRVKAYDESRLINGVSGWRDMKVGDMYDTHNYPAAAMFPSSLADGRISALGEYGGYGLVVEGHIWNPDNNNWGYKTIDGPVNLMDNYGRLVYDLKPLVAQGLSAAIYTQTTDVEQEVNGLITYDREVTKLPVALLHKMQSELYGIESATPVQLVAYGHEQINNGGVERELSINGAAPALTKMPLELAPKTTVSSTVKFNADELYKNMSLWISLSGEAKITLNGVVIFDNQSRRGSMYASHYNVSDYAYALVEGENTLEIEAVATVYNVAFDFGLTAF